jgi:hypothetical protein
MKVAKFFWLVAAMLMVADLAVAQTWTQTSAPVGQDWYSVASSADGNKLVAVSVSPGRIYTSTNSGASWVSTSAPSLPWQGVASSADGVKLAASVNGGGIYTSTNSGMTWMQQTNAPSLG